MNALSDRVARLIAAQGPITVAQYMAITAHERGLGYYAARDPFGKKGDFITAPEVSQMFGELLGLWCVQVWRDQGAPASARLIELGPGRGTLMRDALRAAHVARDFLNAIEVTLIESNPTLRALQEENLLGSGAAISWAQELDQQTLDRPTFVLANEFFDALPLRQFVRAEKSWHERMIGLDANRVLSFVLAPVPADERVPADRRSAAPGSVFETSDSATALASTLGHAVGKHGGAALVIDYGYDRSGPGETLQAIRAHAPTSPLDAPGETDLSAHVDFAALATAAHNEGASCFGPIAQGAFLSRLEIGARAAALARSGGADATKSIERDVERLIAPDKMGELFRVLAILPQSAPKPPGF